MADPKIDVTKIVPNVVNMVSNTGLTNPETAIAIVLGFAIQEVNNFASVETRSGEVFLAAVLEAAAWEVGTNNRLFQPLRDKAKLLNNPQTAKKP